MKLHANYEFNVIRLPQVIVVGSAPTRRRANRSHSVSSLWTLEHMQAVYDRIDKN